METSALPQSASDRYPQAASPIHTILVLAAMGGWAIWHKIFADHLSAAANPSRVRFYIITLFYEWLLFILVVAGVRRSGASVLIVLGDHWRSVRQVLRDIGIAAGFWIVTWMLLWVFGWLLRPAALGRNVSMLPHRGIELTVWIALSVTAGICEETIFRGYLQPESGVKIAFLALDRFQSVNLAQDVISQILEQRRLSETKNRAVLGASEFTWEQEQFVA